MRASCSWTRVLGQSPIAVQVLTWCRWLSEGTSRCSRFSCTAAVNLLALWCRYYLLNTTLPILMCGYLALLVFSMNKASLEARIGVPTCTASSSNSVRMPLSQHAAQRTSSFTAATLCADGRWTSPSDLLCRRHGHPVPEPHGPSVRDQRNLPSVQVSAATLNATLSQARRQTL